MPSLLPFAALMLAPAPASPDWFYLDGTDSVAMYIEASSIVVQGDSRTALTLSAYAHARANGAYNIAVTMGFDCGKRLFRTLDFAALDRNGKMLVTEPSPNRAYRVPGEGSYNDQALRFVCFREGGERVEDPLADAEWRLWD